MADLDDQELAAAVRAAEAARERIGIAPPAEPQTARRLVAVPPYPGKLADEPPTEPRRIDPAVALRRRLERVWATLPERYAGLSLESPELTARVKLAGVVRQVAALLTGSRVALAFIGPSGSGKTTLACAAAATMAARFDVRPVFAPAWSIAGARAKLSLGEGEAPDVERAIDADLLILDDLGIEEQSPRSAVGEVIDERYNRNRVTWVTTGFDPTELAKRYGSGRARRIFAMADVRVRCG